MTALRQQMENDMVLRGMAVRTRQSYIEAVRGLTKFYRRSPDQIAVGEVQSYLLHLLQEPGFYEVQDEPLRFPPGDVFGPPPQAALRLRPPLTPSRLLPILHHDPKPGVRAGRSGHDRHAEPPKSRPPRSPAPYNPQGS